MEWDILGTHLKLSQSEIREIERDHQSTRRKTIAMFDKWLSKEVNPSWMKIIAALENMFETKLASQLKRKYQQQTLDHTQYACTNDELMVHQATAESAEIATDKVLKIDRKDMVAREIECLEKSYLRLVIDAQSAMEAANLSVIEIGRFSQFYMNKEVKTVNELFKLIKPVYFLDYALLETAISFFLDSSLTVVSNLSDYIQQLTDFKSSTTLRELLDNIENAQKLLTTKKGAGMCTVTLHLVGGWLEKTMEDLDRLLKEMFQDKISLLTHLRIIRGSVIVTYFAPQLEADAIVKLAQAKRLFIAQVGVYRLHTLAQLSSIFQARVHASHFNLPSLEL